MNMSPRIKRVFVLVLGWAFIVVGLAGLFLPVIQGILCLLIGLTILSTEYVWAHHLLQKLKAKFPRIAHLSEQASERARKWLAKFRHHEGEPKTCEYAQDKTPEPTRTQAEDR